MKHILILLIAALLAFVAGCSSDSVQRGMYEGLSENRRLNEYPDKSADSPLSYDQYQVERERQLEEK